MESLFVLNNDNDIILYPSWLEKTEAEGLFETLVNSLEWSQETAMLFGRNIKLPRLTAWYGESNLEYQYSGIKHIASGWHTSLQEIKDKLCSIFAYQFNTVLCNYYRDGNDSVGWHSDNEPVLGQYPIIASISLGATRTFRLRHKHKRTHKTIQLPPGSLLLMRGKSQQNWQHCIPKQVAIKEGRINLTYRNIIPYA